MGAMKVQCSGECILVINRKTRKVSAFSFVGDYMVAFDVQGVPIDGARINSNQQLYTVLYYEKLHMIALVVKRPSPCAIVLVFRSGADYDDVLSLLRQTAESVRFSRQNFKISSYADRIAEKLMDGVELAIMDVVDKSEVEACPVCGMEVQPGAVYCMDCGAEL